VESKKLKKKGKTNKQVGKNKTRNQTKMFQRYKQAALVYQLTEAEQALERQRED
jgi:hypothetical protein